MQILRIVLALFCFRKSRLVALNDLLEADDLNRFLFDLLTKRLLHRVSIEEALDFLATEQEFVLDQCLHVDVAFNNSFEELGKVSALATATFLIQRTMACEGTALLRVDRSIIVARGQILLACKEVVDSIPDIYDLLRCVNLVGVATSSRVDLQISPDNCLFIKQSCQNLLHNLVLHVHDLAENKDLISIFA